MKKYRNYKNKLEMYLASSKGRRLINVLYSWGAAIVIIGALFKILHLPSGNQMLFIGMLTEFFVFFISGLEQPEENYRWEQVFPELLSINPLDKKEMEDRRKYLEHKSEEARKKIEKEHLTKERQYEVQANCIDIIDSEGHHKKDFFGLYSDNLKEISEDELEKLSHSLQHLEESIKRLTALTDMSHNTITNLQSLTENTENLRKESAEYSIRLQDLNKAMLSLQNVYENQLKNITNQVISIEKINHQLEDMWKNYDSSLDMSRIFQQENTVMVNRLRDLNYVYARLLEAMTINMSAPIGNIPYSYSRNEYKTYYHNGYKNEQTGFEQGLSHSSEQK